MSALIDKASAEKAASTAGWEGRLRSIYAIARRRALQVLVPIVVAVVLIFYTPLLWWVAEPLKVTGESGPADAIVVFAGGVGESGQAGGGAQERVARAIELYHAGLAPRMILSSGYIFTLREAEVMKAIAVANGVPEDAVLLEQRAANTRDNVTNSAAMLDQHGWKRILLVTSPYHMRRASLTWHKLAPHVQVIPAAPATSEFYRHTRGANLTQMRGILQEYAALVVYWLRGWA
jgi:uncharacterized SAM-binding protein YcdF (DUF218 family)